MRLIDLDEVHAKFSMQVEPLKDTAFIYQLGWNDALDALYENAPEDDPVHAAGGCYCRECELRGREDCAMFYRCDCGEQHTWETDNDFCSYGRRREDADG